MKKNPYKLNTGEELYEFLKDKSPKERKEYFVKRGVIFMNNGLTLNNGLYLLYLAEKENREGKKNNFHSPYDGEFDGLER